MSKKLVAWSYSRYADYDKCPQLAKYKYIYKLPVPENEAMKRGTKVHEALADFINTGTTLSEEIRRYFNELLGQLQQLQPLADQEWGYTKDWRVTGWFARDTWFRSKLDVCIVYDDNTCDVVDFKTGKESPTHAQQAELYTISVLVRYANVNNVTVRFWYLDSGGESVFRFARADLEGLLKKWEKNVGPMLSDEIFAPKPGQHCKWCDFAKSKAGPCKFG